MNEYSSCPIVKISQYLYRITGGDTSHSVMFWSTTFMYFTFRMHCTCVSDSAIHITCKVWSCNSCWTTASECSFWPISTSDVNSTEQYANYKRDWSSRDHYTNHVSAKYHLMSNTQLHWKDTARLLPARSRHLSAASVHRSGVKELSGPTKDQTALSHHSEKAFQHSGSPTQQWRLSTEMSRHFSTNTQLLINTQWQDVSV